MVFPNGYMLIKVNASNPVGRSSSENLTLDLFDHSTWFVHFLFHYGFLVLIGIC